MLIIFFLLPLFLPLLSTVISSLPIWSLQNPSGRTLPFWYSIPSPILYATSQKLGGSRRGQTGAIEKFCSPKNFAPFLSKLIWLLATRFGCFARGRPSGLLEVNFPQTLNNSGRSWALFSWTVDSLPLKFLGCSARGGTSSSLQIFFFIFLPCIFSGNALGICLGEFSALRGLARNRLRATPDAPPSPPVQAPSSGQLPTATRPAELGP